MAISVFQPNQNENQNVSQAPTLGGFGGVVTSQAGGQRGRGAVSGRGSGFTNLQSYIRANESSPNAQIIQQRTGQATEAQKQAQTGFETQAGQARGQLQGIQQQSGLVSSALQDPTKFVQTPENVQRITALRTGQEKILNPTEIQQNVLQGAEGLQSQRGQLASALQRDITGTGLQEYLRSQRVNPALATAGENRLDRFLAEQTPSGQSAIQAGQAETERIQRLENPNITDITTLSEELSKNPLTTQSGIASRLLEEARPETNIIEGINKQYVANQIGVNPSDAQYIVDTVKKYQDQRAEFLNEKQMHENEIQKLKAEIKKNEKDEKDTNLEQWARINASNAKIQNENRLKERENALNDTNFRIDANARGFENYYTNNEKNQNTINKYNRYLNEIQGTRENLLGQYDPNRLARIRALSQLSGFDYNPYLQRGLA